MPSGMCETDRSRRLGICLAAILVVTLSGCAPDWEMATDEPIVKNPESIVRPVDSYMPTVSEMLAAVDQREQDINECLSAAGIDEHFAYPERTAVAAYLATGIDDRRTRGDIWGFFSPDTVQDHGYQRPDPPPPIEVAPLSANGQEACGELLPGEPDPLLLFAYGSLPSGGPSSVVDDPEVERAIRGWSACMAASGYSYERPIDPPLVFVDEAVPSELQISTAETDLRCKEETNLIALILELQADQDELYIRQHAEKLDAH